MVSSLLQKIAMYYLITLSELCLIALDKSTKDMKCISNLFKLPGD